MLTQIDNVRLAFPELWKPKGFKDNPVAYYSAVIPIVPGSKNDKLIRANIALVMKEKFGPKAEKFLAALTARGDIFYKEGPKVDQKSGDPYDGFEGMNHFRTSRNEKDGKPIIVDRKGRPVEEKQGLFYAGCVINVQIDIWVQDNDTRRVNGTLLAVQYVAEGESFGGGVRVGVNTFKPLDEEEEEDTADIG